MEVFKYIDMNRTKIAVMLAAGVLIGMNYSCQKDEFNFKNYDQSIEWTPTFNGPVAYGSLTLEDLLNKADNTGMISTDDAGQIIFTYKGTLNEITANDWLTIPGQDFKRFRISSPIDIPGGFPGRVDSIELSDNYHFVFAKGGHMDSLYLEQGNLNISTHSTIWHMASIKLSSSYIVKEDGDTLDELINVSKSSGDFDTTIILSLNGGKLYLNNANPDSSLVPLNFKLIIYNSGNEILSTDGVDITINIGVLTLNAAYGYVGQYDTLLQKDKEMNLDLFKGKFKGSVTFRDPRLNMTVDNSFGLHIGFSFEDSYVRMKNGTVTSLDINPDMFILEAPVIDSAEFSKTSVISINRNNSNIEDIFTTDLQKLVYSVRIATNPPQAEQTDNFFLKSSTVSVNYEFDLPMDLRVNDLVLVDTIDFNLGGDIDSSKFNINALQIRIETDNGMPVDANLQVYFVNSSYQVLDSLYTDENSQILVSGEVDDFTGRVTTPTNNISVIDLPQAKINNILDAVYAFIQATIETHNGGQTDVRFYSDYSIGFKLGTRVDLDVKLTDDNK